MVQSKRAGGIAGHDDKFYTQFHQKACVLAGEGAHRFFALGPVGHAGRIAEIDDVFAGQPFMQ